MERRSEGHTTSNTSKGKSRVMPLAYFQPYFANNNNNNNNLFNQVVV